MKTKTIPACVLRRQGRKRSKRQIPQHTKYHHDGGPQPNIKRRNFKGSRFISKFLHQAAHQPRAQERQRGNEKRIKPKRQPELSMQQRVCSPQTAASRTPQSGDFMKLTFRIKRALRRIKDIQHCQHGHAIPRPEQIVIAILMTLGIRAASGLPSTVF